MGLICSPTRYPGERCQENGFPGSSVSTRCRCWGAGALTAAWVTEICSRPVLPKEVRLTAYEFDNVLLPALRQTLTACENACANVGIRCKWEVKAIDFIEAAADALDTGLFQANHPVFDVAILNPPYRKFRVSHVLANYYGVSTSKRVTSIQPFWRWQYCFWMKVAN